MGFMKKSIIQALIDLNDRFYTDYGASFASTRKRIQPGVMRIVEEWVQPGTWLDLGCGSGALGGVWVERGIQGLYEGVDFSPVFIAEAQATTGQMTPADGQTICYTRANLGAPDWPKACSRSRYDGVLMFAALHHLPGHETHLSLLQQMAGLLPQGGRFIHSEWQFQRSPKLMARVQDWSLVGLDAADLEPGDTLLDWRQNEAQQAGVPGLRYVHLFTNDELSELADASGFEIIAEFDSDGAGGNLSLYQIWQKK